LDVAQVEFVGFEVVLVDGLAVRTGLALPGGDGALVQPEGGDDGGQGAAVCQEGDDTEEQGGVLVQAEQGGARGGGEGLLAGGAAEASFLVGVDLDVALVLDASIRAMWVGAEYALGVHGWLPSGAMAVAYPSESSLDPPLANPTAPFTVAWGATLRAGCAAITVVNRSEERGRELVAVLDRAAPGRAA